jgi:hypothetical protein
MRVIVADDDVLLSAAWRAVSSALALLWPVKPEPPEKPLTPYERTPRIWSS